MKITHHLGRFATFFKHSSLVIKLVIVASGIGIITGTATVLAMVTTPNNTETSTNSAPSDSNSVVSDTDNQPSTKSDSEQVDTIPEDQTVNDSNVSTSTQTTTAQLTQTATNTNPQQTPTPTPTAPTCNESMKSSYTSLYGSQVASENASWNNQITAWNNYASANGMAFSGYVQSMINDNKPAHDARLAQLQTQYYQNLASINCNP